jgi:hypothetical protein
MADVDIEAALKDRIANLQNEIDSLQVGLEAIQGSVSKSAAAGAAKPTTRRRRGRPAGSKNKTTGRKARATKSAKSSSKVPGGRRQQDFLNAVEKNPGIRAGQVADKIGVSKPHAYALAKVLKDREMVTVKDNEYFVAGSAKSEAAKPSAKKAPAKKQAAKKSPAKKKS